MAAALALMMWGASPALAGGPTSVLVVSPESRETASLYYSDAEYGELERLLGPPDKGTRNKPPEAGPAAVRLVNVSWMVHDVAPWRVDRIFLGSIEKDVWIHTAANLPETPNGVWHRAEHPSDLHKLLYELGVMGHMKGTGSASNIYPAPWETEAADSAAGSGTSGSGTEQGAAADSTARATSGAGDGTGWWWAVPGVVAGAALALVLRPYVTRLPLIRRRKDDPGPRQELLDT